METFRDLEETDLDVTKGEEFSSLTVDKVVMLVVIVVGVTEDWSVRDEETSGLPSLAMMDFDTDASSVFPKQEMTVGVVIDEKVVIDEGVVWSGAIEGVVVGVAVAKELAVTVETKDAIT